MIVKDIGRVVQQEQKSPIISDLEELLSLPGSEIPPALSMMAREIDDTLQKMTASEPFDLDGLRHDHKEALGAIEAALDIGMTQQVVMWTRKYVGKISPGLKIVLEETFKHVILHNLGLRTKVWGKEIDADGFTEHSWQSTIPVAIPKEALVLVGDRILPRQNLIPFFTKLKVMTKGDDPYVVMVCQYGVVEAKLAFYEWDER